MTQYGSAAGGRRGVFVGSDDPASSTSSRFHVRPPPVAVVPPTSKINHVQHRLDTGRAQRRPVADRVSMYSTSVWQLAECREQRQQSSTPEQPSPPPPRARTAASACTTHCRPPARTTHCSTRVKYILLRKQRTRTSMLHVPCRPSGHQSIKSINLFG